MATSYLDKTGLEHLWEKIKSKFLGKTERAASAKAIVEDANGGSWSMVSMPRVNTLRANRFAFIPADHILIEETVDGGQTWTYANYSNDQKRLLFVGNTNGTSIYIPLKDGVRSKLCGVRITITAMNYNVPDGTADSEKYAYWNSTYVENAERYCSLTNFYVWLTSNDDAMSLTVESATGSNSTNWIKQLSDVKNLVGWSGGNVINLNGSPTFGGGANQTNNYWNWRFTFFTDGTAARNYELSGSSNSNSRQVIQRLCGYGPGIWTIPNSLMGYDSLYSWDVNQNATFPAKVSAGTVSAPASVTAVNDLTTKQYVDNAIASNSVKPIAKTADMTQAVGVDANGLLYTEIPQPEDDENVLNLLTEFNFAAPVADADGNVVTDADNNIILG